MLLVNSVLSFKHLRQLYFLFVRLASSFTTEGRDVFWRYAFNWQFVVFCGSVKDLMWLCGFSLGGFSACCWNRGSQIQSSIRHWSLPVMNSVATKALKSFCCLSLRTVTVLIFFLTTQTGKATDTCLHINNIWTYFNFKTLLSSWTKVLKACLPVASVLFIFWLKCLLIPGSSLRNFAAGYWSTFSISC